MKGKRGIKMSNKKIEKPSEKQVYAHSIGKYYCAMCDTIVGYVKRYSKEQNVCIECYGVKPNANI